MATINNVGNGLAGATGTGNFVGSTSPTITTPKIAQINDTNGNEILSLSPTAAAVNFVTIENNSSGNNPIIAAAGAGPNLTLLLSGKGTGGAGVQGTSTNDNAGSGFVGEYQSSNIAFASATNINSATVTTLTSVNLTAGDWDVGGNIYFNASGSVLTAAITGISTTTNTFPDQSLRSIINGTISEANFGLTAPIQRFSLSGNQTVYLVGQVVLASGTCTQCGLLWARRVR